MGKIEKIIKKGPVEGQTTEVYPVTSTKAVYDENNKRLDNIITGLQESVYLNTPIPISTENTTESKAQNVKNIADYVKKAKAAGIADVNGMAVTCIIDSDYSGVGYLYSYSGASIWVTGIITYDETVSPPTAFFVDNEGGYNGRELVMKDLFDQVTSDMLVQGARKPIILTPDTTKVDEETYQKLLSDDVDVVFKTDGGNLCVLTYKYNDDTAWKFCFTCLSVEDESLGDVYLYGYKVSINDTAPHKVTTETFFGSDIFSIMEGNGFINRYSLSLVLQNINLSGTDEERKASLNQFETDWKALTGADDLMGARFVGYMDPDQKGTFSALFQYNGTNNSYEGITFSEGDNTKIQIVRINIESGFITNTPLLSHLEAVPIDTSNSSSAKVDNIHTLQACIDNLVDLGLVDTFGIEIPIWIAGSNNYGILVGDEHTRRFQGFAYYGNIPVAISVSTDGTVTISNLQTQVDITMSDTSTNPVQNKVIKAYIDGLVGNVAAQLAQI